jgi:hypothetical protein
MLYRSFKRDNYVEGITNVRLIGEGLHILQLKKKGLTQFSR